MRVLVFSDVHGNLMALEAVLEAAGPVDAYWCLGDLVGYGPDPEACVQRVRTLPNLICLLGNHDAAEVGLLDMRFFNAEARRSLQWTRQQLSPASLHFLAGLPLTHTVAERVTLVHGSPRQPLEEYLLTAHVARAAFDRLQTPWAFVGHTHQPVAFFNRWGWVQARVPKAGDTLTLEGRHVIVNPGSVGQPRDGDPRAAFAIWDTEAATWTWHRAAYDVAAVQERMAGLGLPAFHIYRLALGR
ncbi:MAG TPA: metallophosphoesterase family protein [Anaerolineae bacterium]|nr:metallophosphoesterase family protein [Anaerolineae bacterium]HID85473.1 metallophosphoesterase [Anaerolineales bacterium]HIQ09099.1 metallophosphoesterase [Anaerolineaceae bacterium]